MKLFLIISTFILSTQSSIACNFIDFEIKLQDIIKGATPTNCLDDIDFMEKEEMCACASESVKKFPAKENFFDAKRQKLFQEQAFEKAKMSLLNLGSNVANVSLALEKNGISPQNNFCKLDDLHKTFKCDSGSTKPLFGSEAKTKNVLFTLTNKLNAELNIRHGKAASTDLGIIKRSKYQKACNRLDISKVQRFEHFMGELNTQVATQQLNILVELAEQNQGIIGNESNLGSLLASFSKAKELPVEEQGFFENFSRSFQSNPVIMSLIKSPDFFNKLKNSKFKSDNLDKLINDQLQKTYADLNNACSKNFKAIHKTMCNPPSGDEVFPTDYEVFRDKLSEVQREDNVSDYLASSYVTDRYCKKTEEGKPAPKMDEFLKSTLDPFLSGRMQLSSNFNNVAEKDYKEAIVENLRNLCEYIPPEFSRIDDGIKRFCPADGSKVESPQCVKMKSMQVMLKPHIEKLQKEIKEKSIAQASVVAKSQGKTDPAEIAVIAEKIEKELNDKVSFDDILEARYKNNSNGQGLDLVDKFLGKQESPAQLAQKTQTNPKPDASNPNSRDSAGVDSFNSGSGSSFDTGDIAIAGGAEHQLAPGGSSNNQRKTTQLSAREQEQRNINDLYSNLSQRLSNAQRREKQSGKPSPRVGKYNMSNTLQQAMGLQDNGPENYIADATPDIINEGDTYNLGDSSRIDATPNQDAQNELSEDQIAAQDRNNLLNQINDTKGGPKKPTKAAIARTRGGKAKGGRGPSSIGGGSGVGGSLPSFEANSSDFIAALEEMTEGKFPELVEIKELLENGKPFVLEKKFDGEFLDVQIIKGKDGKFKVIPGGSIDDKYLAWVKGLEKSINKLNTPEEYDRLMAKINASLPGGSPAADVPEGSVRLQDFGLTAN